MTNFKDIIDKYLIQIPIIQRDYAQGRKEKKVIEIRDIFLDTIYEKLNNNEVLHLDFVYGSIKENAFIPLDGQQRLTTLFLLYWYFGKKENENISFLKKMTYETRASSREFCQKLVENDIDISTEALVEDIIDSKWFLAFWINDPTIKSMLIMLSSIHKKFKEESFFNRLNNITFEFFELEKFGLDDDLYIKMNARGKPLTEFENFKAKFEQFLSEKDPLLEKEFSTKIDQEWTDFFWKHKDTNNLIDDVFMNFFYYISEMLYNKTYTDSKLLKNSELNFNQIKEIYDDNKNIIFLFKALDKVESILPTINNLFSRHEYEKDKIALFDNEINLLERVIKKGRSDINIQQKLILFLILNDMVENEISDDIKDLIRVVRNITGRRRNLRRNDFIYTPNFEYRELNKLITIFLNVLNKNIYTELLTNDIAWKEKEFLQEIDKAKLIKGDATFKDLIFELEDYKYLKGDLINFLTDDINTFQFYINSVKQIFDNQNDSLTIRAMLTSGNYQLSRGGTRLVEKRYFFGKQKYWEIILTAKDRRVYFKKFFENYSINTCSLQNMISQYLENNNELNWKYYFIKYADMLNSDHLLSTDNNLFAWYDEFAMEKMGGLTLNAFHINPFIRTVALKFNIMPNVEKGDEYSYFILQSKINKVFSKKEGWKIHLNKNYFFSQTILNQYNLVDKNSYYLLNESKDQDRIEVLVNLMNDLSD